MRQAGGQFTCLQTIAPEKGGALPRHAQGTDGPIGPSGARVKSALSRRSVPVFGPCVSRLRHGHFH